MLENKSSREGKFPGDFAPGSLSSRERMLQGANWPGIKKDANWRQYAVSL